MLVVSMPRRVITIAVRILRAENMFEMKVIPFDNVNGAVTVRKRVLIALVPSLLILGVPQSLIKQFTQQFDEGQECILNSLEISNEDFVSFQRSVART